MSPIYTGNVDQVKLNMLNLWV